MKTIEEITVDYKAEYERLRNIIHLKDKEILALKNACVVLMDVLKMEEKIDTEY